MAAPKAASARTRAAATPGSTAARARKAAVVNAPDKKATAVTPTTAAVTTSKAPASKTATSKTATSKTPTTKAPASKTATSKAPASRTATRKAATRKATTKAVASKTATTKAAMTKAATVKSSRSETAAPRPSTPTKKAASVKSSTRSGATSAAKSSSASRSGRLAERLRVKDDESPWSDAEIKEVRAILLEEIEVHRQEVQVAEQELDDLLRASTDGAGDDQADAGSKTAERVHEIALAANSRAGLAQAEHALEQLEAGTYGICENCGNPIGKLRLQARPRATLCMTCQEKQDRH